MICVLLSRKSSLDDRFTAGLGGCLALWCDYEVGKVARIRGVSFSGFWGVQFFSFRTHFHEPVARVVVEAAPPSDPGFNLLNLPVVVWFEGVVSSFNLVAFLGILVGHILCLGIMWALDYPILGDVSLLAAFLVRARASSVGLCRFNGLHLDLVVYGHVFAVPEISLSSAVSLSGVFLVRLWSCHNSFFGVNSCVSMWWLYLFHWCDSLTVFNLGGLRLHVPSSMALLVDFNISQCWCCLCYIGSAVFS